MLHDYAIVKDYGATVRDIPVGVTRAYRADREEATKMQVAVRKMRINAMRHASKSNYCYKYDKYNRVVYVSHIQRPNVAQELG